MRRAPITTLALVVAVTFGVIAADALGVTKATKPKALVFFNSLCETCKKDAGQIAGWAHREQRKMQIVGVGFMMSAADSTEFAHVMGWRFPVKGDPAGTLADRYHVSTPTIIVEMNRKGIRLINYALRTALR